MICSNEERSKIFTNLRLRKKLITLKNNAFRIFYKDFREKMH